MNFFKRIFGKGKKRQPQPSLATTVKSSSEVVTQKLLPLIRSATRLRIKKAAIPLIEQPLTSHFGGQPYFEKGDAWPKSKEGRSLSFIFQVFNQPGIELPAYIQLVQFYYDFEAEPWETENDGWLVKIYETLQPESQVTIAPPDTLQKVQPCTISFEKVPSLPSWEGIDVFSKEVSDLCCVLNSKEPWEPYDRAVEKLIDKQDYQSQLGGYPMWLQGEATPQNSKGEDMSLLFQIDSEEAADVIWGDAGLIYAFYDTDTKEIAFSLQCH